MGNQAVFPALQGGPHEHQIAGVATQFKEVMSPEFKEYVGQVCKNAKAIGAKLISLGYSIATGGTDNHLVLWDLKPQGITGSKFEKICDEVCITLNKNCVPGDKSAVTPGGVRIGTPALTTRKMVEKDFEKIGEFLDRALKIALKVQEKSGPKLKDFMRILKEEFSGDGSEMESLKKEINVFATGF